VSKIVKTEKNRWLVFTKPNPSANLRLFLFPYAGGTTLIFRKWHEALPTNVETCSIELPGRGSRLHEPAFATMPPLVEAIAQAISPYLDKPFAFFGHSMGAVISYELSRYLRRWQQVIPAQLFISGRRAPQIPDEELPTYNLPEPEFIEELRRLNGTPKAILEHPELLHLIMPQLRADFAVCQTYIYTPEAPLDCPISVFGGLEDHQVTRPTLEAWREQTTASFSLRMFPGDHFFLQTAVRTLLRILAEELSAVTMRFH
jgi:medium-chain acyl-[acyl-carrier-protein] hydrolase